MYYTKTIRRGDRHLFNPYKYHLNETTESYSTFYQALYGAVEDEIYYLGSCKEFRSETTDLGGIGRLVSSVRNLMENSGREFKACFDEVVLKKVDISQESLLQERILKWAGSWCKTKDEALKHFLDHI